MAEIDIQISNLKKTSLDIESYDNLLINEYFVQMKNVINNLLTEKGIKTEDIRSLLQGIESKVEYYQNEIKNNLTNLEEGIAVSLKGYVLSTEDLRNKLVSILNVMQEFVNGGKLDSSQISSFGYMTEGSEDASEETLDDGEGESSNATGTENLTSDFENFLNKNGELESYKNELESPTFGGEGTSKYYNEYINQYSDTLNGDTKTLLNEFYNDLAHYGDSEAPGINSRFDNIEAFLESSDGQKWAQYFPKEDYTRDYTKILSDPEAALTDYIYTRAVEGESKGYLLSNDPNSYIAELQGDVRRELNNNVSDNFKNQIN